MTSWIENLVAPHVKELVPYESARRLFSGGTDWLNANESPFANDYVLSSEKLNRYPDCQPTDLINAYADYAGLPTDSVLATRGADEGIELLIRAFCEPGQDTILICPPTYGMYAISANTFNIGVSKVPLQVDFSLDVDGIKASDNASLPSLVFICSPNNPTGTTVAQSDLIAVLEHFKSKSIVVVDEAYIEFAEDDSAASLLNTYDNLVVLRTLSKAFALAGIRCGFTLAHPQIISTLLKVIAPYPIADPVAQIAVQALKGKGLDKIQSQVSELNTRRQALQTSLNEIPELEVVGDITANFVLFRAQGKDALMAYLVENGMLIRDQSKQYLLNDCLRVSIGTEKQHDQLLTLIQTFYQTRYSNTESQ